MCIIQDVVEYPQEGFAIIRDNQGSFLAFKETEHIVPLDDEPNPYIWPKSWKTERNRLEHGHLEELIY